MKKMRLFILLILATSQLKAQQSLQFLPTEFSTEYSPTKNPALRIRPGDTVHTFGVDALGIDRNGKKVAPRGNPLTGPFYIEGAKRGQVLAVSFYNVKLNRDFATTLNALIPKVLSKRIAKQTWRSAKLFRWDLDTSNLTATPADSSRVMKGLQIQLHPFIGCVGVASEGPNPANSGASGPYGGNLDSRFITSGATVYLPVYYDGALLYLGDGHAAQGDGELNGDALETSMNFSFSVRVLSVHHFPLATPMIENKDYLMFFGIEPTVDQALKVATLHMQTWLQQKFGFNNVELSQVIGPSVEYRIPKIAASKVEVVAMLPKKIINQLTMK